MTQLTYLPEVVRHPKSVVTVGTFDGVHEGHKKLIQTVVEKARSRGARSVVVSFDPHPREIINPGSSGIKLLTTLEERRTILSELGVDLMVVIPFDRDFSLLTSESFVKDIIFERIGLCEFVIGYDHQFGRNREGTISTVSRLGTKLGFEVHIVEGYEVQKVTVSSTTVRKALEEKGNVHLARQFLGRPYMINGTVVQGDKRGRELGYPTANIKINHPKKIIPYNGVYAVDVVIDGVKYRGMMNIGVRPTFGKEELTLEVNIFDFDLDIYGKSIDILFLERIRDEKKFSSMETLIAQLENDKICCSRAE
ncbi:MAG: bifunctional riboflavin kinase/FAD synthetase [Balneolales bacterium]